MTKRSWAILVGLLLVFTVALGLSEGSLYGMQPKEELPPIPVETTFRNALMGSGYVAQFRNLHGSHYVVAARFHNPTFNQDLKAMIELRPNQTTEFGWGEGWAFSSGESITLTLDGHRDLQMQVP